MVMFDLTHLTKELLSIQLSRIAIFMFPRVGHMLVPCDFTAPP
jgi:hypothetical protein